MERKKPTATVLIIGALVLAALIWIGLGRRQAAEPTPASDTAEVPAAATTETTPIVIGWMGPLTGDAASYGQSIKRAVELAQEDHQSQEIDIVFEDSKCEGKDAVSAVNKLISTDNVVAILGEVCSGATLAAAPIAQQNQIVMISAASTSPNLSDAGDFIFRTVPSDALQGNFGAQLVFNDGHETLAILYSNEEYGVGFNEVLAESFTRLGGEVVAQEAFERTAVDLRTQLTKIRTANPDALYIISNSPDSAVAALQQATQLGLDVALYGSEGLKSPDVIEGAAAAAEGLIVTSVSAGTADFIARHTAAFGEEPGPFAAQAYDAYKAIADAQLQGAATGPAIRDILQTTEFTGVSGDIIFDNNGDVTGNYDILIVKDGEFISAEEIAAMEAETTGTADATAAGTTTSATTTTAPATTIAPTTTTAPTATGTTTP